MKIPFLNSKKIQLSLFLAFALIGSSIISGCNDDEDTPATPAAKEANVLVVHASPNAPAVDLLIDNKKINSAGLTFPNNTGYLKVTEGVRNFKINVSGTATSVINADITLKENVNYSLFAINKVDSIAGLLIEDDLSTPESGKAKVRFLHLSPDAPAVDITLLDGTKVFPDFTYKEISAFTNLAAGKYNLQVRVAGTSTVALTLPEITLVSGKIYTIFAKGLLTGAGPQALGAQIIANK